MPDIADLIQLLDDELAHREEHYELTTREAGAQYGIRRAMDILEAAK